MREVPLYGPRVSEFGSSCMYPSQAGAFRSTSSFTNLPKQAQPRVRPEARPSQTSSLPVSNRAHSKLHPPPHLPPEASPSYTCNMGTGLWSFWRRTRPHNEAGLSLESPFRGGPVPRVADSPGPPQAQLTYLSPGSPHHFQTQEPRVPDSSSIRLVPKRHLAGPEARRMWHSRLL
jgi:hypothetical protein